MHIYSIYDSKGQFYSTPFYSRNDDVATRDFSNVVMNEQNPMSRCGVSSDLPRHVNGRK